MEEVVVVVEEVLEEEEAVGEAGTMLSPQTRRSFPEAGGTAFGGGGRSNTLSPLIRLSYPEEVWGR